MRVCFVSASRQNAFFEELLGALGAALSGHEIAAETAVDHFPPAEDDLAYVFVPHEYLPMTDPRSHPTATQLRRTIVLATEQPGTPWFEQTAGLAASAAATVDIHPLGHAELRRRGVNARLLRLGYVPEWDHWHRADVDRPIEAMFLGGYTPRRARALARCGWALQGRRTSLHLVETRAHTTSEAAFLAGARKFERLASSRVLVSAHRNPLPYFEWQRMLDAATNGCVLLTEHSSGFQPLVPGVHFVSADLDNLPSALAGLLDDEPRLREIREAAYDVLRDELPLATEISVLAEAVEEVGRSPLPATAERAAEPARRSAAPIGEQPQTVEGPDGNAALRAALKKLMLNQRRLERRLARLEHPDRAETVAAETYGPYDPASPRVSVVVTLYNYAHAVAEAVRSVALSTASDIELVLVDDASTDDSLAVARRALEESPWLPSLLLAQSHNKGLPASRNLAIDHARGEYVFILDADNAVYRHALERLTAALDADPEAAFAYGILEKFDSSGPADLISWLPWDPERFRQGNYIDAMAMIRRSAIERVGGFVVDDALFGWEDFALWCAFAEAGLRGILVPEILARYRATPNSMISLTNIDTTEAWATLAQRFTFLRDERTGDSSPHG